MGCHASRGPPQLNVFDEYEFDDKIGRGEYSQVRRVKHKETGGSFAAKIIIKEELQYMRVPYFKEIQIMKKISHEKCVTFIDSFEDDYICYIIMDLYEGGMLFDKLEDESVVWSEWDISKICLQMLNALAHVHAMGICHRDVKPENWLFKSKIDDTIKLIDFGLAVEVAQGEVLKTPVGTLHYAAPEVLRSAYGQKCDIWALGVVIFLSLFGNYPFEGENDEEVMRTIIVKGPTWGSQAMTKPCKDFLCKSLAKQEDRRFTAAEALHHAWIKEASGFRKASATKLPQLPSMKNIIPADTFHKAHRMSVLASTEEFCGEEEEAERSMKQPKSPISPLSPLSSRSPKSVIPGPGGPPADIRSQKRNMSVQLVAAKISDLFTGTTKVSAMDIDPTGTTDEVEIGRMDLSGQYKTKLLKTLDFDGLEEIKESVTPDIVISTKNSKISADGMERNQGE